MRYFEKQSSQFKELKKHKIPLTEDERKAIFKGRAIWHSGFSRDPNNKKLVRKISAVWKARDPRTGKVLFITNTHRAYNVSPTLTGIINRFHKFIKGTA